MNTNKRDKYGFNTLALHYGYEPKETTNGASSVPIYQTAAYVFESAEYAAALFSQKEEGPIYTRINNPTTAVFEKRIAALEGAEAGLATASGQAAIYTALLVLLESGDEVVASSYIYGGTYHLLADTMIRYGIKTRFINPDNFTAWEEAITEKTKVFFLESPGNPRLNIMDIERLSKLAHQYGIYVIVDNTFNTPYLSRPIELGADTVVHSATKYIAGHGNAIGGVIVGLEDFINQARNKVYRDTGPAISPFNSWLFIQGLETLGLRMEKHSDNAMAVARWLEADPRVEWVSYPGLASHPQHELAKKQQKKFGGMICFGIKGGYEAGKKFINSVELCTHLANLGDTRTLVIHPASTTHEQLCKEEQEAAGVTDDLIRLSVGIEDVDDIIVDLDQALDRSQEDLA